MKPEEQVRADFEAMTVAEHAGADISRNASGGYQNFYLQCAWEGYRAAYAQARREALEEAARLAEKFPNQYLHSSQAEIHIADVLPVHIGKAIRALMKE